MPDNHDFEKQLTGVLDRLYAAALRMTKNRPDAEDLVSEAVTKALKNKDSLQDPASFRGWIFRIRSNTFLSNCRKQKNFTEVGLPDSDADSDNENFWLFDRLHQPFLLWWSNPEQNFLDQILQEHIQAALDELPEEFRVVVVLTDMEGMKYLEVAETLELPVGTVRSRLSRARGMLQKLLWPPAIDHGIVAPPLPKEN